MKRIILLAAAAVLTTFLCACVGETKQASSYGNIGQETGSVSENIQKSNSDNGNSLEDKVLQDQDGNTEKVVELRQVDFSELKMSPVEIVAAKNRKADMAELYLVESTGKFGEKTGGALYYLKNAVEDYIYVQIAPVPVENSPDGKGETNGTYYLRPGEGSFIWFSLNSDVDSYFYRGISGLWEDNQSDPDITDQLAKAEIYQNADGSAVYVDVKLQPDIDFRVTTRVVMNLMKDGVVVDRYYTNEIDFKDDRTELVWRFDIVGDVDFDSCYLEFMAVHSKFGKG